MSTCHQILHSPSINFYPFLHEILTEKQIESSIPFSPSRVLSDDIEYDPDFVDPLNHSSQSVLNQEPSNHPHVDTSILDCGIDSQVSSDYLHLKFIIILLALYRIFMLS